MHVLLTTLTALLSIFFVGEVIKISDLEQVIFDVLNTSGRSIFDKIIHNIERFKNTAPIFGFFAQLIPQMLHDNVVVVPVVRVVSNNLQLAICNVPVITRG
jgi:hypothetical protein